jgi:hypothetical protein
MISKRLAIRKNYLLLQSTEHRVFMPDLRCVL